MSRFHFLYIEIDKCVMLLESPRQSHVPRSKAWFVNFTGSIVDNLVVSGRSSDTVIVQSGVNSHDD